MKKKMIIPMLCFLFAIATMVKPACAEGVSSVSQGGDAELAQELSNPLADLMTIPIQMNYDREIDVEQAIVIVDEKLAAAGSLSTTTGKSDIY